jgi:hypothetical protein
MTRFPRFLTVGFTTLALAAPAAHAGINWIGGDGGTTASPLDWSTATNWTGSAIPDSITEVATFLDSPTGRVVTTPTTATSVIAVGLTQSSNAVSRVMLGADLTLVGGSFTAADRSWNNTSGNAANLVLDLNGHVLNYSVIGAFPTINGPMTITSGVSGGVVKHTVSSGGLTAPASWSGLVVGPNVTYQFEGATANKILNLATAGTWDENSTLLINYNTNPLWVRALPTTGVGNLVLGDPSLTTKAAVMDFGLSQTVAIVKRDVTINTFTGATGGAAADFKFTTTNSVVDLRVGGNWTDAGTDATGYNSVAQGSNRKVITFNGGAVTERTVSIGRTGLLNDFAVGDSTGVAGYVKLAKDLTTTGFFTVRAGSRLNLDDQTLTVAKFTGTAGMTLDFAVSDADSGIVNVTGVLPSGNLVLPNFTLNLTNIGTWTNGNNLVLFTYAGTQIAAPTVTYDTELYSFDSVMTDGGQVYLTNFALIPEPATLVLSGLGAMMILARRKRA